MRGETRVDFPGTMDARTVKVEEMKTCYLMVMQFVQSVKLDPEQFRTAPFSGTRYRKWEAPSVGENSEG